MIKVFVNGTFDILHPGHIALFEYAKKQGDYLLVAIDADSRVKELKGESRPINNQEIRVGILSAIKYIDQVKIFDTSQKLTSIIKEYQPDVMVVGSDYRGCEVIGSEYAKQLLFFERDTRYSSTKVIETISSR